MTAPSPRWMLAVVALAVLFVAPLPALASAAGPAAPAPTSAAHPSTVVSPAALPDAGLLGRTEAAMAADHIPAKYVYLPNFHPALTSSGSIVSPGYVTSPAPMGVGDLGIVKVGTHNVGTINYTNSVEGRLTVNAAEPFYLASTSPDYFGSQLNTVATHVDVLGNTSGQYWTQNVIYYSALSSTVQFIDNIWNFSSPTAAMQSATLHSYFGNLVPNDFYYAYGPAFKVTNPFSVTLYNNLTVFQKRPTVWFNYTLQVGTGTPISGTYDRVEFNSSATPHPVHAAPMPTYQINGVARNPLGLVNDAEMMIGGPGGGSTTTLNSLNATMGLFLKSNTTGAYSSPLSAVDFGSDTGETSEGIAAYAATTSAGPMVVLGGGPSILTPLWGMVGATSGYTSVKVTVRPSNSFVFASLGSSFRPDYAAWAPLGPSGVATYRLPAGHPYAFEFLLSEYTPHFSKVTGSTALSIHLGSNPATGVYTPLWAWDNSQLAAISQGGNGTLGNPYVLDNNRNGTINPLFGEFNDYVFQVFPGLLLANTNSYVAATDLTDFPVAYSITPEALWTSHFGLPNSNNLALELYNATHVSLVNNPLITGWWGALDGFGNSFGTALLVWNCSHDLIGGNSFVVQSNVGLELAGAGGNVIWGNTFTNGTTTAPSPGASIVNPYYLTGALLFESGDTVYNNAFRTVYTAYTPTSDLYTGGFAIWTDRWNVSVTNASLVRYFNGQPLTGSILGLPTVAGNYWDDYGAPGNPFGVLPYDEYGAITVGGDMHPELPYALYKITFDAKNLTAGTYNWTVTIGWYSQTTSGLSLVFWEPSGIYGFVVTTSGAITPHPYKGAVVLTTHNVTPHIRFT